jgi:hypothetical protein
VPHHAALNHHLRDVVERQYGMDARHGERRFLVDAFDDRVRMWAAQERDVMRTGDVDVVNETPCAAQERFIFKAKGA